MDLLHSEYIDLRKKMPFPNTSIDVIFNEHVFEHLIFPDKAIFFLKECHRILKKGGVLRIGLPDFEFYAQAYLNKELLNIEFYKKEDFLKFTYKETAPLEMINFLFKQNGEHKFIYDFNSLKFLVRKAGFENVQKRKFNESFIPDWDHDNWKGEETMYVECVK